MVSRIRYAVARVVVPIQTGTVGRSFRFFRWADSRSSVIPFRADREDKQICCFDPAHSFGSPMSFTLPTRRQSRIHLQRSIDSGHQRKFRQSDTPRADFEELELVGRGTFSEVWRVRNRKSGRWFALKRLKPDWRDDPAANRLLKTEARVGQLVCSPYAVRVVQSDLNGNQASLIQEWLDGSSLEALLSERKQIPIGPSVWIVRQCAMGLAALEQAGFSHGDVKPANIFVTRGGNVKLIDFGFARPLGKQSEAPAEITGTVDYMAPETVWRGESNPVARDMYSLGITLFRMLTGRLPFLAETPADMLRLQRQTRPPSIRRWCSQAPGQLTTLVSRLLAKQPVRRPSSLRALIDELIALELTTLT